MRIFLLVDGENFKKKIEAIFKMSGKQKPGWKDYNFEKLFEKALRGISIHKKFFYIARIRMDVRTPSKSKELIESQRQLKVNLENQDFEVISSGHVRGQITDNNVLVFKEKGVDVKIAVDMVRFACDKLVDQIIIASSDSDLQPAIEEVKKRGVKLIYLGFETQPNKGLIYTTGKAILLRDNEVLNS